MRRILRYLSFLWGCFLTSCSSPLISMKCQEIRVRLANAETEDQKRFVAMELEECEKNRDTAKSRDSTVFQGIQQRFTPVEDSL